MVRACGRHGAGGDGRVRRRRGPNPGPIWASRAAVADSSAGARILSRPSPGAPRWPAGLLLLPWPRPCPLLAGGAHARAGRMGLGGPLGRLCCLPRWWWWPEFPALVLATYLLGFHLTISVSVCRARVPLRWWPTCSSIGDELPPAVTLQVDNMLVLVPVSPGAVFDPGENPARLARCGHGDTCGCHFLLGGVFLGLIVPPLVPGETLGLLCRTGQRRRFDVVSFMKALPRL